MLDICKMTISIVVQSIVDNLESLVQYCCKISVSHSTIQRKWCLWSWCGRGIQRWQNVQVPKQIFVWSTVDVLWNSGGTRMRQSLVCHFCDFSVCMQNFWLDNLMSQTRKAAFSCRNMKLYLYTIVFRFRLHSGNNRWCTWFTRYTSCMYVVYVYCAVRKCFNNFSIAV